MGAKFLPVTGTFWEAAAFEEQSASVWKDAVPLSSARLLEECDLRDLEGLGWIQRELNLSAAG